MELAPVSPIDSTTRMYEVERRTYHAVRPGFRIVEMRLGRAQIVPWHFHSHAQDTFYVISGAIRLRMRKPEEEVTLEPEHIHAVRPGRPHSVENAGRTSAVFLILQGIGEHDFVPLA
jgi:mannose-6-phosphate isomerase-like protein (cupin superfamily)